MFFGGRVVLCWYRQKAKEKKKKKGNRNETKEQYSTRYVVGEKRERERVCMCMFLGGGKEAVSISDETRGQRDGS